VERFAREMANKDRYHPPRGAPEPRLVPRGEGVIRTIYPRERREFVCLVVRHHTEKVVGERHGYPWVPTDQGLSHP
jgi:hypothetical protein